MASGVTTIGDRAFSNCRKLASITIPSGVTTIGVFAFRGCEKLTSITIAPGVTTISEEALASCEGLRSITLPDTVTTIGWQAFMDCEKLTSITIPSSVTTISPFAFSRCERLASITIASGVPFISDRAFAFCHGLRSITLPDTITSIGRHAFKDCKKLASITIPSSVTTIKDFAFDGCDRLRTAIFLGDAPKLSFGALERGVTTIYYFVGQSGFSSPTWNGFPAFGIRGNAHPIILWFLTHGHSDVVDLRDDPNGDGVSLLMAYALGLDPNLNLSGSLPEPVLDGGHLTMSFHAASPGITYVVETSTDLQTWTSEGVTTPELSPDDRRTAMVQRDSGRRFLRLRVEL